MLRLQLPFPPSVNQITAVVRGRKITSKRGREYRKEAVEAIRRQYDGGPIAGRLHVIIELYPPDRRRRDCDNFSKATLDVLTCAGVYEDDSQIDHLEIIRCEVCKPGKCIVTIEEYDG